MHSLRHPHIVRWVTATLFSVVCYTPSLFSDASQKYWVYFGTFPGSISKGIYVSRLDAAGNLSSPELAAVNDRPVFLVVDRQHRFLYAANEINNFKGGKGGAVTAFAIDATTGKLTLLNQVSAVAPGPDHIEVDATGKVVMVANYDGSSVTSFPVKSDGSLGVAASFIQQHGSSINPKNQTAPHAHSINMDPANRFAFVCDLGLDKILSFEVDLNTGTLTPNDPAFTAIKAGSGPRHLSFRPDGKFVYVINETVCTMTAFAYDAQRGTLTEIQTVSTLPEGIRVEDNFVTAEVFVHPSGKFLYGSNRGHNSIVVYQIDEKSGKLAVVQHVPSGGKTPRNFNLDPTGHFLLSANQDSGNVVVFGIDQTTGRLTPTGGKADLQKPTCVVFAPAL